MLDTFLDLFEYISNHWQEASVAAGTLLATLAGAVAILRKKRKGDK